MALSTAQLATVKTYIQNTPALAAMTSGPGTDFGAIAQALSAPASPAFVVWKTGVTPREWRNAIMVGMAQLDNLTAGKRDSLLWVVQDNLDCSLQANRDGIDNLCGTQNVLKAAMVAAMKRNATVVEKLLATGTGSDASPAVAGYEGGVSLQEVASLFL